MKLDASCTTFAAKIHPLTCTNVEMTFYSVISSMGVTSRRWSIAVPVYHLSLAHQRTEITQSRQVLVTPDISLAQTELLFWRYLFSSYLYVEVNVDSLTGHSLFERLVLAEESSTLQVEHARHLEQSPVRVSYNYRFKNPRNCLIRQFFDSNYDT